jgi:3-isopropylmalate/(R)-2-methylmalate dehydratase large subunit
MGMTLVEKILSRSSGSREVRTGEIVMAKPDLVMLHETGVAGIQRPLKELSGGKVNESVKAVILSDHFIPAPNIQHAENQKLTRAFAKQMGATYYEIGRGGIAHQVLVEYGHIRAGSLVIATDAHATMYGAAGAAGIGVGVTDMAVTLSTGKLWLMVPQTIRILLKGQLGKGVLSKDVALFLVGHYREDGLNYKAVELDGPLARESTLSDRLCLTNMLSEAGAKVALFGADRSHANPDPDASYEAVEEFDLTDLEPMVALPHSPANVKPVKNVSGVKVDQVFIGSCTNGRIEDLRIAAQVLKDHALHPRVRLIITPASQRIYLQALAEGLLELFVRVGATVTNPTCGACVGGHLGLLAAGEVCVATSNRNFKGRMGSSDAGIYLASPLTAAVAAVTGEISDPLSLGVNLC